MARVEGLLSIERRDGVALVTLQRPEKRNALSIDLRVELAEAFAALADDDGVGCVVLTGAGTAFCAGMDVTQFGGDRDHKRRLVETSTGAFTAVGSCPKPVVAAVNGPALAGGFALALLCDVRIAAQQAAFGFPEVPRGIPASYASARSALPGGISADLAFSGRTIDADEALRLGVVSEVVPGDRVVERSLELADRIAGLPGGAAAETKRRILLERERLWGFLFAEEERVFKHVLLGDDPDEAA
jgi:enoyl-CoA hydratase/carnithine racemase